MNKTIASHDINKVVPPAPSERQAWTVKEFRENFRVGNTTVYRLIKEGKLKTVLVGGRRLIPVASAEALLKSGTE